MKKTILATAALITSFGVVAEKNVTYLGDDRYTCRGSDCGSFNARESQYQGARASEKVERWRQEDATRDLRVRSSGGGGIVAIPSAGANSAGAPPTYIYVPTR